MGRKSYVTLGLWKAYRQRSKRRALLWRALRSRHQLRLVQDNLSCIPNDGIILVSVLRNERMRLPYFLQYYRQLGVTHFLIVDNDSDDGGVDDYLIDQKDISIWHTTASYRASRFGVDWQNWLLGHYGRGKWCLTVDVDELLVFTDHERVGLPGLTQWLDRQQLRAFGALMLDLYPREALDQVVADPSKDPLAQAPWFDVDGYRQQRQAGLNNLWVQGGVRERCFFPDSPHRAPTLNKLPLVKWSWRYSYVNSTHSIRPPTLNLLYDGPAGSTPAGVLLHTKFLPDAAECAEIEAQRGEHFANPVRYTDYYERLSRAPVLWCDESVKYENWQQLADLGMVRPERLE